MSDATKAALDAAISAHIADENDGAVATSWVVLAEHVNLDEPDDDMSHLKEIIQDRQSSFQTLGMLHFAVTQRAHA